MQPNPLRRTEPAPRPVPVPPTSRDVGKMVGRIGLPAFVEAPADARVTLARDSGELASDIAGLAARDAAEADKWLLLRTPTPRLPRVRSPGSHAAYVVREADRAVGFALVATDLTGDVEGGLPVMHYRIRAEFAYVVPEARGRGLGRLVVSTLLDQAGHDASHILPRLVLLGFDGILRATVDGVARGPEGAAMLDALASGLSTRIAGRPSLAFDVDCRPRRFAVTKPEDEYRID